MNDNEKRTTVVVSINVHEKPEYLMRQIDNIRDNLRVDHRIMISANDHMHKILQGNDGFFLNPEPINKRRYHGSITQGIVSNMRLASATMDFDWFLVMSSRDFFYRPLKSEADIVGNKFEFKFRDYECQEWHWPSFHGTKLFAHLRSRGMFLSNAAHEGLCFDARGADEIIRFLDENKDIEKEIFQFDHCMEEFALQSICCNFRDYYNISNGVFELGDENLSPTKFTRKLPR